MRYSVQLGLSATLGFASLATIAFGQEIAPETVSAIGKTPTDIACIVLAGFSLWSAYRTCLRFCKTIDDLAKELRVQNKLLAERNEKEAKRVCFANMPDERP